MQCDPAALQQPGDEQQQPSVLPRQHAEDQRLEDDDEDAVEAEDDAVPGRPEPVVAENQRQRGERLHVDGGLDDDGGDQRQQQPVGQHLAQAADGRRACAEVASRAAATR